MENLIDYKACLSKTQEYGEKRDCSVKAIAIVLNTSYEDAHQLCKEHGRLDGKGFCLYQILAALKSRGFEIKKLPIGKFTDNKISVKRFENQYLSLKYLKNPALIFTACHVAAVKNNIIQDFTSGSYKHIQSIYEIIPTTNSIYSKQVDNIEIKIKERKEQQYRFALAHKETGEVYIKYKRKPSFKLKFAVANNDIWITGKKEETKGKLEIIEL